MKTINPIIISFISAFLMFTGCAETDYNRASKANTIRAYQDFVAKYPDTEYTPQAKDKIEELYWQQSKNKNSIIAYDDYLKRYPAGKYVNEAKSKINEGQTKIEDMAWSSAKNIKDYDDYLKRYPAGKYVNEAKIKIEDMVWANTEKSGKIADYESYINNYDGGRHYEEARERIEKLFWRQTTSKDTIEAYKEYVKKYPNGSFIKEADEYVRLAAIYRDAGNNIERLEIFIKNNPETSFAQKAGNDIEKLIIEQVENKGIGKHFFIRRIMPQDKGHKGNITIMSQEGNSYVINAAYYNDAIAFAVNPYRSLFTNMEMKPSQPLKSGSVWRFVGKGISFADCVFNGEGKIEKPLTFILLENRGFVHIRGSGSVQCKDGTTKELKDYRY